MVQKISLGTNLAALFSPGRPWRPAAGLFRSILTSLGDAWFRCFQGSNCDTNPGVANNELGHGQILQTGMFGDVLVKDIDWSRTR